MLGLTLEDIGLYFVRSPDGDFSTELLFKELVGDVIILVLCVFQSHVFFHRAGRPSFANEVIPTPLILFLSFSLPYRN